MLRTFIRQGALAALLLVSGSASYAQLTGTKTIPGDYPTLAAAITDLNTFGVGAGGVTINLTQTETAPVGGYRIDATGTMANPIIINGTGTAGSLITAALQTAGSTSDAIIKINGGDYITLSNLRLTENAANTVVSPLASQTMTEAGIAIGRASTTNGAQNNTVTGCSITMRGTTLYNDAYGVYVTSRHDISATDWTVGSATSTVAGGQNNNNTFTNNTISNVFGGFIFLGGNTTNDVGNIVGGSSTTGNSVVMGANTGTPLFNLSGNETSANGIQAAGNSNFTASYNTVSYTAAVTTGAVSTQNAIFVTSAVAVANSVTNITNNVITMNQSANTSGTNVQRGIYDLGGVATGTININSNTVNMSTGTNVNGAVQAINDGAAGSTANINSNTINPGTFTGTGAITWISNTAANSVALNISNNTISAATYAASGVWIGISNTAANGALTMNGNNFGAATYTANGALTGISNTAVNASLAINSNNFGAWTKSGTGAVIYIINSSSQTASCAINSNTFGGPTFNSAATGALTFISNSNSSANITISGNATSGNTIRLSTSGDVIGYTNGSAPSTPEVITNNNFSNISMGSASSGAFTGITTFTSTNSTKTVTSNTISNITVGTGSFTGLNLSFFNAGSVGSTNTVNAVTGAGTVTGISAGSSSIGGLIQTNTVSNLSSSGASSTVTGMTMTNSGGTGNFLRVQNNTVSSLSASGTTAPLVVGIGITGGLLDTLEANTITGLTVTATAGTGSVNGIRVTGGTTPVIMRNRVYTLSTTANGATAAAVGINFASGTPSPATVSNNFVSDLNAVNAVNSMAVVGISLSTTTASTYRLYYNTVYLTPTASAASLFGATGVLYTSTATSVDLRNNIINVNAAPAGAGTIAALRRNIGVAGTAPTNYASTSNNNIFYAPNATNSYLYAEDSTTADVVNTFNLANDPNFNTVCGSLYKAFMTGRDGATVTENNLTAGSTAGTFVPSGTSFAESKAQVIAGFTTDFSGTARSTTPDIGALEFSGTPIGVDLSAPLIAYTSLANSYCLPSTLTATITDAGGVNTSAGTAPRIYYKKSTDANTVAGNTSADNGYKFVEGVSIGGNQYTFTFNYGLLQSALALGETLQYFVVAQDLSSNVGINQGAFATGFCATSVALTASAFPLQATPAVNSFQFLAVPTLTLAASTTAICNSGTAVLTTTGAAADANANYVTESAPAGSSTFTVVAGLTTPPDTTAVLTPAESGIQYRVSLRCGTTVIATSNVVTITVNNPGLTSTTPGTRCGTGTVSLAATGTTGTSLFWYSAATGGSLLATGSPFTTPTISSTTDFYVSAANGSAATIGLSPTATNCGTIASTTFTDYPIRFNTTAPVVIQTVQVIPQAAGAFTVALRASLSSTDLQTASFTFTTGQVGIPQTIALNFSIPTSGSYQLTNTVGGVSRVSTFTCTYPYTGLNGAFSIVGSATLSTSATNTTSYNSFFNFVVTTPDFCESARTAVTATVTPAPVIAVSNSNPLICGSGSSTLTASSATNPTGYTYTYTPGNLVGAQQTVTPTATTTYTVNAVDNSGGAFNGCVATPVSTTVTVGTATPAFTLTPASTTVACGAPATQITASSAVAPTTLFTESFDAVSTQFATGTVTGTPTVALNTTYYVEGTGSVLFNTTSNNADVNYAMNSNLTLATGFPVNTLTFSHICALEGTTTAYDYGYVQYSVNGGTTWTSFPASSYVGSATLYNGVVSFSTPSYAAWNSTFTSATSTPGTGPATSLWRTETLNIPAAALGSSQFRIRFRITTETSTLYYGWLIDNVRISQSNVASLTFSPRYNLFTDAAATTAYTGGSTTTVYAKPSSSITYVATAANGPCTTTATSDFTVTGTPTALANGTGSADTTRSTQNATSVTLRNNDCELLATVTQSGGSQVTGNMRTRVVIDGSVQTANAQPFVQRHYDITPDTAASTATATVTLYATQAEFDAYNTYVSANALSYPLLPTGGVNNGNVRVTKFAGTSTTYTPTSYTPGTATLITPTVAWNSTNLWWEITFPVSGFSGFFIHSGDGGPLNLTGINLAAANDGARNRVTWQAAGEEVDGLRYTLERSADGRSFAAIETRIAAGTGTEYVHYDLAPFSGANYYRVRATDASGRAVVSRVASAFVNNGNGFALQAFPNPVTENGGILTVRVQGTVTGNADVTLTDATGKLLRRTAVSGTDATFDINSLPAGLYLVRYTDGAHTETVKVTKQ